MKNLEFRISVTMSFDLKHITHTILKITNELFLLTQYHGHGLPQKYYVVRIVESPYYTGLKKMSPKTIVRKDEISKEYFDIVIETHLKTLVAKHVYKTH